MYIAYRNTSLSGISSIHIYADSIAYTVSESEVSSIIMMIMPAWTIAVQSRRHPAAVLKAAVVRDHRVREDIVELPDQRVPQDQVEQQALPVPQDLPGLRKPFAVTVRSRFIYYAGKRRCRCRTCRRTAIGTEWTYRRIRGYKLSKYFPVSINLQY